MSRSFRTLSILPLLVGCADYSMSTNAMGDMGISAGGSEDVDFARTLIEDGMIPAADSFTSEGLFSEHDLPVTGEDCEEVLCPRGAAARFTPVDGAGEKMLVQLGFGTKYTYDTFEREPLNLGLAVDISGSMSDGKLDSVKDALRTLVDQLDGEDSVALVAFDDYAELMLSPTVMDARGKEDLLDAIDLLDERGGTNIEAGLAMAYGEIAPEAGVTGVEDRVMLFSDAQPNIGGTGVESFLGMANYYAEAEIGLSVLGVGIDMGTELAIAMSETPGGNYYYLATKEDIATVFDDEFDFMVSPVAYNLRVNVTPVGGLVFKDDYGAPSEDNTVQLSAATLFLSARDGGMGATLAMGDGSALPEGGSLVDMTMAYEPRDEAPQTAELAIAFEGTAYTSSSVRADDLGVFKMAVLVDGYLALEAGAKFCTGELDQGEAITRVDLAADHLDEVAAQLADAPLADLALLVRMLSDNISRGVEACAAEDWYGY